jgi:site-specific DNA-methyltransferase (adenine-specific)
MEFNIFEPEIIVTNEDNMDMMARYPDNYFDLAIVDPPYGINADEKNSVRKKQSQKSATKSNNYGNQRWDSEVPNDDYFNELFRVSKKQIVWGANYFGLIGGMIYWHKNVTMPTYSTGELAWVSWLNKIDFVNISWHGMVQEDMKNKEIRIHPTQKPVQLYKWLLDKYAKEGDKILDTHLGSGSIAIACHDYGFNLTACELDKDYYEAFNKRFKEHKKHIKLF